MFDNIPQELQALRQWVCWKYVTLENGKQTKIPVTTKGSAASPTDPRTWCSFEEAKHHASKFSGIGFVLTANDPFTIIDLDNKPDKPCTPEQLARHQKIYGAFESYTETSVSGTGVHIIVKGRIPAGVHRDNVEVYSSERYMACTGNVLRNLPIQDYQPLLDVLYNEMQSEAKAVELVEVDESISDEELVDRAMRAANGDKFTALCNGDMTGYPSQSEADFALLSILAFYTKSNEQVRRIFRMTALGKRDKAVKNNTYLDFAIGKIRGQQAPEIDFSQLVNNFQLPQPASTPEPVPILKVNSDLTLPPGLVGEVAAYFYQTSFMQIPEVALAAAIAMFGAIVGRQYNINGQGLSHYLVLLGETGTGKEGAATGIDRLFGCLRPSIPMVDEFRGPAAFASGPALSRALSDRPSMLSIQGEFGFTVNRLNNAKPGTPESTLKQVMLDAYTKASWSSTLQTIAYSDKEKNIQTVQAPNLNILGESTQTRFFEGLDVTSMEDGLIPRLLIIENKSSRPYPNRNHGGMPSKELLDKVSAVIVAAVNMQNGRTCHQIKMDAHAHEMHWKYTDDCIDLLNAHHGNPIYSLWSRAAAITMRLAGLISVGVNYTNPVITTVEYEWARQVVERSIRCLTDRFKDGDIGEGDSKQMADARRAILKYFAKGHAAVANYASSIMYNDGLISHNYLLRHTVNLASFKNDPLKSNGALKKTIQALLDSGELVEVSKNVCYEKYKTTGRLYKSFVKSKS